MATAEGVKKLAALARIRVAEDELERFTSEFDTILGYISQLETLDVPSQREEKPPLRNVMRDDSEPHAAGQYTERLAEQFPSSAKATEGRPAGRVEGVYLEVKQVISHE